MVKFRKAVSNFINTFTGSSAKDTVQRGTEHRKTVGMRQQIIRSSLSLSTFSSELLALLFHPEFYKRYLPADSVLDDEQLLQHFLKEGIGKNLSPGPFFNVRYCFNALNAQQIDAKQETSEESQEPALLPDGIILQWLKTNEEDHIVPTPLFSDKFYLKKYPDVRAAGINPFYHFLRYGENEGRMPVDLGKNNHLVGVLAQRQLASSTRFQDIISLFPEQAADVVLSKAFWNRAWRYFFHEFYAAQCDGVLDELNKGERFSHFYNSGVLSGLRPTPFFNEAFYRERLKARNLQIRKSSSDTNFGDLNEQQREIPEIAAHTNAFCHWLYWGHDNKVVPTMLFDATYYKSLHKDLSGWKSWIFDHFILHGCKEAHRKPSPFFDNSFYKMSRGNLEHEVYVTDFLLAGQAAGARPSPRLDLEQFETTNDLSKTSQLEQALWFFQTKSTMVERPVVHELIEKAKALEPQIGRPLGEKKINMPGYSHDHMGLYKSGIEIQRKIGSDPVHTIVLLPHCRLMSGASRNGIHLANAVRKLYPNEKTLVLFTDFSEDDRPEWLDGDLETIDLAGMFPAGTSPDYRQRILLDIISGLRAKRIINANSRLGWDLMLAFGTQMKEWLDIYPFIFCWDKDAQGNRVGYPIRELQLAYNNLKGIFVDANFLKNELIERYCLPKVMADQIHVVHTTAQDTNIDNSKMFAERRSQNKPLRAFWAGRFDRQKRLDVLVEILRLRPDLELWMYGKPVLGGAGVDMNKLPENIKLMGTYKRFDELPFEKFDFFLYTSEWDGLPNMIILAGAHGIPTISSNVGGVGDLLDAETGYPVDEVLNPQAYIDQLDLMLANPQEVTKRAKAFRVRTHKVCSQKQLSANLKSALEI